MRIAILTALVIFVWAGLFPGKAWQAVELSQSMLDWLRPEAIEVLQMIQRALSEG